LLLTYLLTYTDVPMLIKKLKLKNSVAIAKHEQNGKVASQSRRLPTGRLMTVKDFEEI